VEHQTYNAAYVKVSVEDTVQSVFCVRYKLRLRNG
jgi:hypothetical protein